MIFLQALWMTSRWPTIRTNEILHECHSLPPRTEARLAVDPEPDQVVGLPAADLQQHPRPTRRPADLVQKRSGGPRVPVRVEVFHGPRPGSEEPSV